mgnify:CR=1 FL=1|jgi:hypothetical protein
MTKIFAKLMGRKSQDAAELETAALQAALLARVNRVVQMPPPANNNG